MMIWLLTKILLNTLLKVSNFRRLQVCHKKHLLDIQPMLLLGMVGSKKNGSISSLFKYMLQCVAVCCSGLLMQCDAVRCSVPQCASVCCSELQCVLWDSQKWFHLESLQMHVAVCCSVLQCVALCCSVLRCVAVCCSVLQCVAVCCSVLQCVAVRCSVLQCVAVCCSVLQTINSMGTSR